MATEITYPNNAVIDAQQGGTICANTSHGAPGGSADCDAFSDCQCCGVCAQNVRSVRFSSWDNPVHDDSYTDIKLRLSWSVTGGNTAGQSCDSTTKVYVEYRRTTGGSWVSAAGFPKTVSGAASGTSSTTIPSPSPWTHSQFRVRAYAHAKCVQSVCSGAGCSPPCPGTDCSATLDVDNVRLEGTYPVGACCQGCGNCITGQTPQSCTGVFQGDGTDCTPDPCTQPTGACCGESSCTITTSAACTGTWKGCGTSCSPDPCSDPTGACCTGLDCNITTSAACAGPWTQGASCAPNPCVSSSGGGGSVFSFGI